MTSPRTVAVLAGWILLLTSILLAAAVTFGIPIKSSLHSASIKSSPENGFLAQLPELSWPLSAITDGPRAPRASATELLEDGRPLGPAHTDHTLIRSLGQGRYSHWQDKLVFSTSDNSDPRTNGRRYVVVMRAELTPAILLGWFLFLGVIGTTVCARWLHRDMIATQDFLLPVGLWTGTALLFGASTSTKGIGLWLLLGVDVILLIWAVTTTRRTLSRKKCRPWKGPGSAQNATLLVAALTVALVMVEALLIAWEHRASQSGLVTAPAKPRAKNAPAKPQPATRDHSNVIPKRKPKTPTLEHALEAFGVSVPKEVLRSVAYRAALITLPPELQRTPAEVPGAESAYTWHGVLHVKDRNHFRQTAPFPARQGHVFRIMVVGDSFTYGQGIDERWTYARQLAAALKLDYNVEVLNLGVSGHQSEDILGKIRYFLPRLRPDLVIYGVCLNDFLPTGIGQYANNYAYTIPLPESLKAFFTDNSRLARLSRDAYNRTLLELGLRVDFFDDILNGFTGYRERFAHDVVHMNELVTAQGLPPVVAITLDQEPHDGSRGHQIIQTAEQYLKSAGMDVIEMAPYYQQFNGLNFRVSRWDGHPNEVANIIWATMLARHLRSLDALGQFQKMATE